MKLFHLSDLHLGKRVNDYSMLEDQEYILKEILAEIDKEQPDAVLIAGDVYDKSVPSAEAVQLFDDFLVRLSKRKLQTYIISGNHDSPERLAFGGRLIDATGIHLSPVYDGTVKSFTQQDAFGDVCFYLLPFIKPAHVKRFYPDEKIENYTDAVALVVREMHIDTKKRNVLIAHQFVTGAEGSGSEDVSVGGLDNVDHSAFEGFDYVALGHIHRRQKAGQDSIRYSGSPLKYSFSETKDTKSITVVELGEKGNLQIREIPLVPKHDLVELKGTYMEVTAKDFYEPKNYKNAYVHITLTDEEDIPDAMGKLRVIYPLLMHLSYDNTRTRHMQDKNGAVDVEKKSPLQLFSEFYEGQNGMEMKKEQEELVRNLVEKIWEDRT